MCVLVCDVNGSIYSVSARAGSGRAGPIFFLPGAPSIDFPVH